MKDLNIKNIITKNLWLIFFITGLAGAVLTWLFLPHNREKASITGYTIQITLFVIIVAGISFFPNKNKLAFLLLSLPILAYLCYVCPKMGYTSLNGLSAQYYTLEFVFLFPLIVLSVCFAYRIGGGKPGNCIKFGVTSIIFLFSGILDLMWFIVNNVEYSQKTASIPHIEIFIGHTPKLFELLIFIIIHFILAAVIFILPINKWIGKLLPEVE